MTFALLKDELNRLPLHDLAETGVESVAVVGTGLAVETNGDDLAQALDDLKACEAELKDEQERCTQIEGERDTLQQKLDDALVLLAEVKEGGSTATLATYREQAEDAMGHAETWKREMLTARTRAEDAQRECTALRKRKGVESGVVRHHRELLTLLGYICQSNANDWTRYKQDAAELLAKVRAS